MTDRRNLKVSCLHKNITISKLSEINCVLSNYNSKVVLHVCPFHVYGAKEIGCTALWSSGSFKT